jgi:hypothetical protein
MAELEDRINGLLRGILAEMGERLHLFKGAA